MSARPTTSSRSCSPNEKAPRCPECLLEPEDPYEALHLAIFGYCIDCVPEDLARDIRERIERRRNLH
jgi:hypothetical protein